MDERAGCVKSRVQSKRTFQKVMDERAGHHMALVLNGRAGVSLERDAHQLASGAVHHGPAAVAAVHGGVHRHRQRARVRVRVRLQQRSGSGYQ